MTDASPVRRVDGERIVLDLADDRVVDVLFDGRRVWSFWSRRDTERSGGARTVPWPAPLRRFLRGVSLITIRETVSGEVLFEREIAFGEVDPGAVDVPRVAIVNRSGQPLSLDKDGRLGATFGERGEDETRPLLDAIDEVLGVLGDLGVEAFLAYGTLLGAVREGNLLGHDSDADLGYVSAQTTPVEVIRESFQLQRQVAARGYRTQRYSGAAFKIYVAEGDGLVRGLDVFGGFFDDGLLYLMGEVGHEFAHEWIYPLGTSPLAGRRFPTPAVPEKLLEAMYGPGWRVPDPAFKFDKDPRTQQRLNGWFRGITVDMRNWDRTYSKKRRRLPRKRPSELARLVLQETTPETRVLDVGAGRGRDAWFLARRGRQVTAYDYLPKASTAVQEAVERRQLPLEVRRLNLLELRSVLGEGARIAQGAQPRAILAVHCLDATYQLGREGFMRFAAMSLRGGGRLYADFFTRKTPSDFLASTWPIRTDEVVRLVEQYGGTILKTSERSVTRHGGSEAAIGRVVAQWT
ncbi:MAG: hypothetical protein QM638_07360 [Nocardioides sp.]|uniref:class I SAM-dependent methyltransferase n=1 Tax=Nocardioides sp. TaxID=35761 RepID=UPI0039E6D64D